MTEQNAPSPTAAPRRFLLKNRYKGMLAGSVRAVLVIGVAAGRGRHQACTTLATTKRYAASACAHRQYAGRKFGRGERRCGRNFRPLLNT
jgi:hypothetical protein